MLARIPERSKGRVLRSRASASWVRIPLRAQNLKLQAPLAQSVERCAYNAKVESSILSWSTNKPDNSNTLYFNKKFKSGCSSHIVQGLG